MPELKHYEPLRSATIEDILKAVGADWKLKIVPINEIKIDKSVRNNARLGEAVDQDTVLTYATGMDNGKKFPPIVLASTGDVYDGIHRLEAAVVRGDTAVPAYVITNATAAIRDRLTREINVTNGKPLTKEHRIEHAIFLCNSQGMSISEAANRMSLKYDELFPYVKSSRLRAKLEESGVNTTNLHHSALVYLSKVDDDEVSLCDLANIVITHSLPTEDVRQLATSVSNAPRTLRGSIIREWRSKIVRIDEAKAKTPIRQMFQKKLDGPHGLLTFLLQGNSGKPFTTLEDLEFKTEADKTEARRKLKSLGRIISTLTKKG